MSGRLDPSADVTLQWSVVTSPTAWQCLKGTATNPTAGETVSRVSETTLGDVCEVALDDYTLAPREVVTSAVLNLYCDTQSGTGAFSFAIYVGGSSRGSGTCGPTAATAWRTFTDTAAYSQSDVNDMRIRLTCTTGSITAVRAHEGYVQLNTAFLPYRPLWVPQSVKRASVM